MGLDNPEPGVRCEQVPREQGAVPQREGTRSTPCRLREVRISRVAALRAARARNRCASRRINRPRMVARRPRWNAVSRSPTRRTLIPELSRARLLRLASLRAWRKDRLPVGPVFAAPVPRIEGAWKAARDAAGLSDVRSHDLRHTAASYLAVSGASPLDIASILGHRTLSMVRRYSLFLNSIRWRRLTAWRRSTLNERRAQQEEPSMPAGHAPNRSNREKTPAH